MHLLAGFRIFSTILSIYAKEKVIRGVGCVCWSGRAAGVECWCGLLLAPTAAAAAAAPHCTGLRSSSYNYTYTFLLHESNQQQHLTPASSHVVPHSQEQHSICQHVIRKRALRRYSCKVLVGGVDLHAQAHCIFGWCMRVHVCMLIGVWLGCRCFCVLQRGCADGTSGGERDLTCEGEEGERAEDACQERVEWECAHQHHVQKLFGGIWGGVGVCIRSLRLGSPSFHRRLAATATRTAAARKCPLLRTRAHAPALLQSPGHR